MNAPILIPTFDRISFLQDCVNSLRRNHLASDTILVVSIDYSNLDQIKETQERMLKFLKKISDFKHIEIIQRDSNLGVPGNIIKSRQEIFEEFDSVICSEDDNLFHPQFLDFINFYLNSSKDDPNIFSVCGYQYPNLNENRIINAMSLPFFSAWGYGVTKEKFSKLDYFMNDIDWISPLELTKINNSIGDNFFFHYVNCLLKKMPAGDTSVLFHQYKYEMHSIFPSSSLVLNQGFRKYINSKSIIDSELARQLGYGFKAMQIAFNDSSFDYDTFRKVINFFKRDKVSKALIYMVYLLVMNRKINI